jgi:hypothetical protein
MDPRTELACQIEVAEGELGRVDAHAVRFVHRPPRLLVAYEVAVDLIAADDARPVAENLVEKPRLGFERRYHLVPMGDIEVAAVLRVAVDFGRADQVPEEIEGFADFAMQPFGHIDAPALDPLRTLEPAGGNLRLTAIAGAAAPGDAIGLEHRRLDAMLLGQMDRAGEPRISGADDSDVDVHIACNGPVVGRRSAGRADPVGRRIVLAVARIGRADRIIGRIEGLPRCDRSGQLVFHVVILPWRLSVSRLRFDERSVLSECLLADDLAVAKREEIAAFRDDARTVLIGPRERPLGDGAITVDEVAVMIPMGIPHCRPYA